MAAREQVLAQFLARHPSRQRLLAVVGGQRRDDVVLEPRVENRRHQHVAGADRLRRGDQRVGARVDLPRVDAGARRHRRQREAGGAGILDHHRDGPQLGLHAIAGRRVELEPLTSRHRGGGADRRARRARIQNQTAANRHRRRIGAQDVAVAAREDRRCFEPKPGERSPPRGDRLNRPGRGADQRHTAENLGGALMEPHPGSVLQGLGAGQDLDDGVGQPRFLERTRCHECLPARDLVDFHPGQVDRGPLAGHRLRALLAMHLHAANLHAPAARRDHQLGVGGDAS